MADYIRGAEDLHRRMPEDLTIGFQVIKGMRDKSQQGMVNFECSKDRNFSLERVKHVMLAAYQTIGQVGDGEDSHPEGSEGKPQNRNGDLQIQIQNSMLQGMRSLTTQNETIMAALNQSLQRFGMNGNPTQQGATGMNRPVNVTCFECGQRGHYKSDCPEIKNNPDGPGRFRPPQVAARAVLARQGQGWRGPECWEEVEQDPDSDHYLPASCVLPWDDYGRAPVMAATQARPRVAGQGPITRGQTRIGKAGPVQQTQRAADQRFTRATAGPVVPTEVQLSPPSQDEADVLMDLGDPEEADEEAPAQRLVKGKVKELVQPRMLKVPDPIRAMQGSRRFDIRRVMELEVSIPLGQLLNESIQLRKEVAYGLQSSSPRYRLKKSAAPAQPAMAVMSHQGQRGNGSFPPAVTAQAHQDDGKARPIFITAWVDHLRMSRTLVDGGSLVELISLRMVNKLPHIPVEADGHVRISLADDQLTTLTRYVVIPVNVEGVEAMIKAYILPVNAYDLLLGIRWERQVDLNVNHRSGTVTLTGSDDKRRTVPSKLAPLDVLRHLPIVEVDAEEDELDAILETIIQDGEAGDSGKEER